MAWRQKVQDITSNFSSRKICVGPRPFITFKDRMDSSGFNQVTLKTTSDTPLHRWKNLYNVPQCVYVRKGSAYDFIQHCGTYLRQKNVELFFWLTHIFALGGCSLREALPVTMLIETSAKTMASKNAEGDFSLFGRPLTFPNNYSLKYHMK